jgi:hypothetical protein
MFSTNCLTQPKELAVTTVIDGAMRETDNSVLGRDHTIVLLQIHGLRVEADRAPLVFHGSQFRRLAAS